MNISTTLFPRALLFMLGLFALSECTHAARLVSDADPTGAADKCVYQEGSQPAVETPVQIVPPALTGSCNITLDSFSAGAHNLQVWFRSSVWGVDSTKVPFGFTKPAAGGPGPTGLKITQ